MNIGMIGNLEAVHSTESDRKWSFEELGHKVIGFQENKTTAKTLIEAIDKVDMLVYSHTHGWEIKDLKQVFKKYKANNIPTVSVHLDRWAWLDRVKDVGSEATWFTEYQFMADGSPEAVELYNKFDLNWYYLPPAVVKRACYIAEPDYRRFPHEIIFTGSKNYHSEYPFRPRLINFLQKTYGDKFCHYGLGGKNVLRGANLNTLYASSKIVVGDSCFGGRPYYTSDRYQEVRGRGGFLIHPHVEGVEAVGVAPYIKEDLNDLKRAIDHYLSHDSDRESMRAIGHTWVKNNETYTHRAQTILDKVLNGSS